MSYEKELAELRKEWKKSTDKYGEAIEYGYDADMWARDVMEIERQIYVYEQAAKAGELRKQNGILSGQIDTMKINLDYYKKKADEYEAKAEAFDAILKSYDESYSNSHLGDEIIGIIQKYAESRDDSDER